MKGSVNTIRKQTLLFNYNGKADGFALQKEVSEWCNFTLIPQIEQQLDMLNFGENYLSIDKLEIEATVNSGNWKQKISDELIFSLKQKLSDYKPTLSEIQEEIGSKKTKLDELILFYFENGYLPWWGKTLINTDFNRIFRDWINEEMSVARAAFFQVKLEQISSKNGIERIINLVPRTLQLRFLKNIYTNSVGTLEQLESFITEVILNKISPETEKRFVRSFFGELLKTVIETQGKIASIQILQFVYSELKSMPVSEKVLMPQRRKTGTTVNPLIKVWNELLTGETKKRKTIAEHEETTPRQQLQKEIDAEEITREKQLQYNKLIDQLLNPDLTKKDKSELATELQEGIFIDNAGAVIFAAFIPALLNMLELEKNGKIVNPDLAALVLQYCVSGRSEINEFELVLPKILCGLEIDYPLNTNIRLSEGQMNEANEMLQSLIEYWSILKDTSVDGLRESFLKRSGKLSFENKEWILVVDQRPYDMLLERIPWSISMIKFPWMENLLKTEWV